MRSLLRTCCLLGLLAGCAAPDDPAPAVSPAPAVTPAADPVPAWAAEAVFYQIFPERFHNGDPTNDPVRASLEFPERAPASWAVTSWTADWYARAPWEQAMGEGFYDSVFHRRYGGDLQGVLDRLDYLDSLGVNTLYFNPVFYARSLHKYDGNTFHHVDPYFGPDPEGDLALMAQETADPSTWRWTAADRLFLDLIEAAHARGLRVIIDGVFNHTGRDFFAFADLRARQAESPYKDWYIVRRFDDPATPEDEFDYKGWWDVEALPEFADTEDGTDLHPGPKQYVFDATRRWMDPNGDGDPADGLDGWRLDVANEVPVGFWAEWNALVRTLNPAAYTVSEVWEEASTFLQEGGFSATMNYYGFAFPVKGFLIDRQMAPSAFAAALNERRAAYGPERQHALQNLIDSHDTDRLASMIVNAGRLPYEHAARFDYDVGSRVSPRHTDRYDVRKPKAAERSLQRLVALFQMTYVGAPMIYYGTEAGMWGADDPDDRMPMVWPERTYDDQVHDPLGRPRTPDAVAFDHALFDDYRRLIHLRTTTPALQHGAFEVLLADDARGLLAFSRTLADDALVVLLNPSDAAHSVRVPLPRAGRYELALATTDAPYRVQQDAEALLLEVAPRTGLVLRRMP